MTRMLLYISVMALAATACSSIDCPVQNSVYTVYRACKSDGTADTLRDTLTVATTRRDGTDSVLLNRMINTTEFSLPISYTAPADTLLFFMEGKTGHTIDTVCVSKENTPHFESVDCNISYFHHITAVTHTGHAIDSIAINKPSVNYDASTEHFHIYFKARP